MFTIDVDPFHSVFLEPQPGEICGLVFALDQPLRYRGYFDRNKIMVDAQLYADDRFKTRVQTQGQVERVVFTDVIALLKQPQTDVIRYQILTRVIAHAWIGHGYDAQLLAEKSYFAAVYSLRNHRLDHYAKNTPDPIVQGATAMLTENQTRQ